MGLDASIEIIFQEDIATHGEICNSCKDQIDGKKYEIMLQVFDVTQVKALGICWCEYCKAKWDALPR